MLELGQNVFDLLHGGVVGAPVAVPSAVLVIGIANERRCNMDRRHDGAGAGISGHGSLHGDRLRPKRPRATGYMGSAAAPCDTIARPSGGMAAAPPVG